MSMAQLILAKKQELASQLETATGIKFNLNFQHAGQGDLSGFIKSEFDDTPFDVDDRIGNFDMAEPVAMLYIMIPSIGTANEAELTDNINHVVNEFMLADNDICKILERKTGYNPITIASDELFDVFISIKFQFNQRSI